MFEDIYLHQRISVMMVVGISSMVFLLIFFMEMILKWIGFGFRKYFTDTWCWLEFLIINVSRRKYTLTHTSAVEA